MNHDILKFILGCELGDSFGKKDSTVIVAGTYLCPLHSHGPRFLSSPSCFPIHNHRPLLLQVSATDEDGPLNSAITYSLVGGNQLGYFDIHPKKGELQVAKALDWEQVSHAGGPQSELFRAEESPTAGPEDKSRSTPHADTSRPALSVSYLSSLWDLCVLLGQRQERGRVILNLP